MRISLEDKDAWAADLIDSLEAPKSSGVRRLPRHWLRAQVALAASFKTVLEHHRLGTNLGAIKLIEASPEARR